MVVTSYVGHDEIRSAHRQAISQEELKSFGMLRVFLLAEIPKQEIFITQKAIVNEHERFRDIVQGNFQEAYRNLTYKHIMGLRWASVECPKATFIIKMDDDTVYDIFYLRDYLESFIENNSPPNDFLAGFILANKKPIRNVANKWYVSIDEYSKPNYPNYLSGWLYITNPKTAQKLVIESQRQPFMWIDDTWVTGVLRELKDIKITELNHWYSANSQFLDCCIDDIWKNGVKCDYYVGPNDGDGKLIVTFTKAIRKCYEDENACIARTPDKLLTRTCVGKTKNLVEPHGNAIVRPLKL